MNPKVLFLVSGNAVGGTETFIFSIIPRLREYGIDTCLGNLWEGETMKDLADKAGVPYLSFPGGGRVVNPKGILALMRHLRNQRFDIIYGFGLRVSLIVRLMYAFVGRPTLLIGLRGIDTWRKWYHVWPDEASQNMIRYFICNSMGVLRARRRREHTSLHRLCLIPNGINVEYYSPEAMCWPSRKELNLPDNRILLTVANLRHQKGHDFYLDAIAAAVSMGLPEDIRFLWIGKGPLEADLMGKAERLGLRDRILLKGLQEDVRPYLANADGFVLPSKEEGMPRALMEAMAMSLPVLATDVGGTGEILRNGVNGLLSPYGQVEDMAKALIEFATNWMGQTKLKNVRARITEHFDIKDIARQHAELFERLVRKKREE